MNVNKTHINTGLILTDLEYNRIFVTSGEIWHKTKFVKFHTATELKLDFVNEKNTYIYVDLKDYKINWENSCVGFEQYPELEKDTKLVIGFIDRARNVLNYMYMGLK